MTFDISGPLWDMISRSLDEAFLVYLPRPRLPDLALNVDEKVQEPNKSDLFIPTTPLG